MTTPREKNYYKIKLSTLRQHQLCLHPCIPLLHYAPHFSPIPNKYIITHAQVLAAAHQHTSRVLRIWEYNTIPSLHISYREQTDIFNHPPLCAHSYTKICTTPRPKFAFRTRVPPLLAPAHIASVCRKRPVLHTPFDSANMWCFGKRASSSHTCERRSHGHILTGLSTCASASRRVRWGLQVQKSKQSHLLKRNGEHAVPLQLSQMRMYGANASNRYVSAAYVNGLVPRYKMTVSEAATGLLCSCPMSMAVLRMPCMNAPHLNNVSEIQSRHACFTDEV